MRRIPELAALALAAALAGAGCSSRGGYAPAPWLPKPRELARWPYGASAAVWAQPDWRKATRGELIALGSDSVYVLTADGLVAVPCRRVVRLSLQADRSAGLPAPMLSFDPKRLAPGDPLPAAWQKVRPFARFPGGLPDSLDRASLRLPPGR